MTPKQFRFLRRRLREMAESSYQYDVITWQERQYLRSFPNTEREKSCAEELLSRGEVTLSDYSLRLELKRLREINGKEFSQVHILDTGKRRPRRACFVGHRFLPGVEKMLRWNLRQVLESYNVNLDWSGKDIRSVQIFDDIVDRIDKADFCIFDNRATSRHPNVYIEVGVAYALKTPFILFQYGRQRTGLPANLSHSFAIRYYSYQKLFRELYSRLPAFFMGIFEEES